MRTSGYTMLRLHLTWPLTLQRQDIQAKEEHAGGSQGGSQAVPDCLVHSAGNGVPWLKQRRLHVLPPSKYGCRGYS
jgi:hypothetical protein